MIVCVAAENGIVCPHFGHCPEFAFFMVEEDEVRLVKTMANPGHVSGALPPIIREWGVTHVIAGAMGSAGIDLFRSLGIEVFTGVEGNMEDAVRLLAAGELASRGAGCAHHGDHGDHSHDCDHHDCGPCH